jgi:hypothetical protein
LIKEGKKISEWLQKLSEKRSDDFEKYPLFKNAAGATHSSGVVRLKGLSGE